MNKIDKNLKKVLLFSHNSNLSGAPISLTQLAGKLPEYGFSPLVILPKPGPIESILNKLKVKYKILNPPGRIFRFIMILLKEKPLLIHVNTLVKSWPVIVARVLNKPVIWHVREYLGSKRLYARIIHFIATKVIVISHSQFELFKKMKKAVLVYNGIDFSLFENAKPLNIIKNRKNNPVTIIYLGSIEPRKGIHILAEAASILASRLDKTDIRYLVVGEAPEQYLNYKEKIIAILRENNIFNRFYFLGQREDIPQILAEGDILCHPALIEVFGRVIIEAMASKLPVVATRVGEIPWIMEDGFTGYIVEPGEPEALAHALEKLASNKKLRKDMGHRGYEKAKKIYNIDIHAKKIAGIYSEIISKI